MTCLEIAEINFALVNLLLTFADEYDILLKSILGLMRCAYDNQL
jgi:hypothetical protein